MALTDKERFILHFTQSAALFADIDIESLIDHILKHRCRKLDLEEVKSIVEEMKEEQLLSKSMWEEPF